MSKLRATLPSLLFCLLMLLMLWQIPKTLDLEPLNRLTVPMAAVLAAVGLAAVWIKGIWKKLPMLLILAGLGWAGACSLLRGTLWQDLYTYVPAACAMLFCFAAGYCHDEAAVKKTVRWVCVVWVTWITLLSIISLYAAFSGQHLHQTAANRFIGISPGDNRLYIMDFCTNAAGNLMSGILIALIGAITAEKALGRLYCCGAAMVMLAALSLTDARTSFIGTGVGVGAILACMVYRHLSGSKAKRYVSAFFCAGASAVLCYLFLGLLTNALGGMVPGYTSALIPTALADDGVVSHRVIGSGSLLTYRDDVWRGFLAFLKAEPRYLLTGTGPSALMSHVMPYVSSQQAWFDHPHCIFLQILGAYGIPGLLVVLTFLAAFARTAWRLIFSALHPLQIRLLPVPAIAIMVCELVECLTLGRVNSPVLILLFLDFGLCFAADSMTFPVTEGRH